MTDNATPTEGTPSEAPAAPVPGSPEYNAAMASKYESQGAPAVPPKPSEGHDKFYDAKTGEYNWTAHNQEKAWQEQQKKPKADPNTFITEPEKPADVNIGDGLKEFSAAVAKGDREGSVKIAQQLMAAGVAQESLQMQVEAVQATQAAKLREVMEYAGGEASVAQMKAYAQKNLKPEEAQAYREALSGPQWKMAVDSLRSRMGGARPNLDMDGGGAGGMGDAQPFASQQEMVAAMRDPRYRTDKAYHQSVVNRISLMK